MWDDRALIASYDAAMHDYRERMAQRRVRTACKHASTTPTHPQTIKTPAAVPREARPVGAGTEPRANASNTQVC